MTLPNYATEAEKTRVFSELGFLADSSFASCVGPPVRLHMVGIERQNDGNPRAAPRLHSNKMQAKLA